MKTILITGANRGLGLEFVRQYQQEDCYIIACCRNPDKATNLQALANDRLEIIKLDVNSDKAIDDLVKILDQKPIDILVCNAGIYGERIDLDNFNEDVVFKVMQTNTMAPIKLAKRLLPNLTLSDAPCVVAITSKMGSIADNTSGGSYAYRMSKAALNIGFSSFYHDTKDKGLRVLLMHPGWVQTDMGGNNALITPAESITGICSVINSNANFNERGFYNYNGDLIPW